MLPELSQQCNQTPNAVMETDNEAIKMDCEPITLGVRPDLSRKIEDYNLLFQRVMQDKKISFDELSEVRLLQYMCAMTFGNNFYVLWMF